MYVSPFANSTSAAAGEDIALRIKINNMVQPVHTHTTCIALAVMLTFEMRFAVVTFSHHYTFSDRPM